MKKIAFSVLTMVIMSIMVAQPAQAVTVELLAGQDMLAGTVTAEIVGTDVVVTYQTSGAWLLTETHLQIECSVGAIPQKNGNPIPGDFDYSMMHDPPVASYVYTIPIVDPGVEHPNFDKNGKYLVEPHDWSGCETLYIAAHAVVNGLCSLDLEEALPEAVTMCVDWPESGDNAYFPTVNVWDTFLAGEYEGWCLQSQESFDLPCIIADYSADVYSSYDAALSAFVDHPENLPKVNWILNYINVGDPSACVGCDDGLTAYTYGDIQQAIWQLASIQNDADTYLNDWCQCRVDEIVAAANAWQVANGDIPFVPGCGDYLGIVLIPYRADTSRMQPVIIKIPCNCDETAWGDGTDFSGKNWATYFTIPGPAD